MQPIGERSQNKTSTPKWLGAYRNGLGCVPHAFGLLLHVASATPAAATLSVAITIVAAASSQAIIAAILLHILLWVLRLRVDLCGGKLLLRHVLLLWRLGVLLWRLGVLLWLRMLCVRRARKKRTRQHHSPRSCLLLWRRSVLLLLRPRESKKQKWSEMQQATKQHTRAGAAA
jgi:hypothetical protein